MKHDPLCFIENNPLNKECRICELIANVRQDERIAAMWRVQLLVPWSVEQQLLKREEVISAIKGE